MKTWLILIALLVISILLGALIQFWCTRRTMAEFARQHDMTFTKPRRNPFDIGTIQGKVGHASFFMGSMSTKYTFGPFSEAHYPDEKSIYMKITVDNMPRNMIIRRRGKSGQGDIVEMVLSRTGYSVIKTRDEYFDVRFDVIGAKNEVLGWLTDHRRDILKAFLAIKNCAVADGSLKMEFTRSFIDREAIESAFSHIRETQLHLAR
jgi:hypothetical protein